MDHARHVSDRAHIVHVSVINIVEERQSAGAVRERTQQRVKIRLQPESVQRLDLLSGQRFTERFECQAGSGSATAQKTVHIGSVDNAMHIERRHIQIVPVRNILIAPPDHEFRRVVARKIGVDDQPLSVIQDFFHLGHQRFQIRVILLPVRGKPVRLTQGRRIRRHFVVVLVISCYDRIIAQQFYAVGNIPCSGPADICLHLRNLRAVLRGRVHVFKRSVLRMHKAVKRFGHAGHRHADGHKRDQRRSRGERRHLPWRMPAGFPRISLFCRDLSVQPAFYSFKDLRIHHLFRMQDIHHFGELLRIGFLQMFSEITLHASFLLSSFPRAGGRLFPPAAPPCSRACP